MNRLLTLALVLVALPALAKSRRELVSEAQGLVRQALDVNDETDSDCQMALEHKLEKLARSLKSAARSDRSLEKALHQAKQVREKAEDDCPGQITTAVEAPLDRAIRKLNRALNPDDDDNGDDDDDVAQNAPPPPPPPTVAPGLDVGPIGAQPGQFNGAMAAMINISGVRVRGMAGHNVVFGLAVKSFSGNWLPAVSLDPVSCADQVCAFPQPLTFYYPDDQLRGIDTDGGRFVAMFTATDAQSGQQIGSQQLDFRYRVRPPQVGVVVPPPPPPPPGLVDCGVGPDPACVRVRNGSYAMDRNAFAGFLNSLRGNPNEVLRRDSASAVFASRYITSRQLGPVLDLFPNEILRFEIAQRALGHVVDPENALALAGKFQNAVYRNQFTQLAAQQR